MFKKLGDYKHIFNENILFFFAAFVGIRIISFAILPYLFITNYLTLLFLVCFVGAFFYKPQTAWLFLVGELLLGGAGHFFELYGISIRTALILLFLFLWFGRLLLIKNKNITERLSPNLVFLLIVFFVYLFVSTIIAIYNGHAIKNIVQDTLPFILLGLIHPAYVFFQEEKTQRIVLQLLIVFVLGSAVFSLLNLILFASGSVEIHNFYYKWLRDTAMGKITNMGSNFFRIVFPEHLLFAPLNLLITALLMKHRKNGKKVLWILLFLTNIILAFNLSRAYFLGLAVGLLVLKYKQNFKKWIPIAIASIASIFLIFSVSHLIVSGGKSFGLELLGLRASTLIQPENEVSTATRMALLTPITNMIKQNPIFGSGMGASIIFFEPNSSRFMITTNFDWGYLEIIAELGIIGLALIISVIIFVISKLLQKIKVVQNDYRNLFVGMLASIICLLVINITSPALFHTLGVFYLLIIISISSHSVTIWDKIKNFLFS